MLRGDRRGGRSVYRQPILISPLTLPFEKEKVRTNRTVLSLAGRTEGGKALGECKKFPFLKSRTHACTSIVISDFEASLVW